MKQSTIIIACLLAVFLIIEGVFYVMSNIGETAESVEKDARTSQKISDSWLVAKDISDTLAAMVFYPEDKTDCTLSVYIHKNGPSFGYFFRYGGSVLGIEKSIVQLTPQNGTESAFVSMNKVQAAKVEIKSEDSVETFELDSSKPFAIILQNKGEITFYDINGEIIEIYQVTTI